MQRLAMVCAVLCTIAVSTLAQAETWIAICNDGKNLQYNQRLNGGGFLYMKVEDAQGKSHTYQIARLQQTFYNRTAICGSVIGNGKGSPATGGHPITQICANKSRENIYVKYKHPTEDRPFASGVYCQATVRVR
jgi:hypothetical protein